MEQQDERRLHLLTPQQFHDAWTAIRPVLLTVEPHCHGEICVDDIPQLIDDRSAFALVMSDNDEARLVGIMEILEYPRKTVMNTIMVAGRDIRYFFTDCRDDVARIAKSLGATCIRGSMRPSVSRLLQKSTPRAREIYSVVEIDL